MNKKKRHTYDCSDSKPRCAVFSELEIIKVKQLPYTLKTLIGSIVFLGGLFAALLAATFVPFQTVSDLARENGKIGALLEERHVYMKEKLTKIEKRLYWINKYTQETNNKTSTVPKSKTED